MRVGRHRPAAVTFTEPRGGAAIGEFVQVDDVPFAGTPDDEPLTGQVEVCEQQPADVSAAERVDADQHHHEALEVVLRMAEDAGQPVRGHGRRGFDDPGENEAAGGIAEDRALLPKGSEDIPQDDVDRTTRATRVPRGTDDLMARDPG
jgi:hypothetical protein